MANRLDPSCVIAVVGGGAMGAGIAQVAAAAGHVVKLHDTRSEAVAAAIDKIRASFRMLAEKGRMSTEAAEAASARLQPAASLAELSDTRLVVEAIVEDLDIKRRLFAELEDIVAPDCILASNTSSLSITALSAKLRHPARMVGMHFFNPVPLMALVEVISGLATDTAVAEVVHDTALAWGKSPVHARSTPGFIVNRVARPFYAEGLRLLNEQAATPATIDALLREAGGFRMGPFELMDLIGHDVNYAVTSSVFQAYYNDPRFTPSLIQQELVLAGFLGRKTGRGFYRYGTDEVRPEPHTEAPQPAPAEFTIARTGSAADAIAARLESAGIAVKRAELEAGIVATCQGAVLAITDGRSATQRAQETGIANTLLLDLALDYTSARRVGLSAADQCEADVWQAVTGLLQAAGYAVSRIDDIPGMAVMRTVAMLANEAADTVNQGICSAAAADTAMLKGVNYPRGPLAWADALGASTVATVLDNLAKVYGEDRYRVSPLLRRKAWTNAGFHA